MIIKKKADTYNTYNLEVSWGQLEAFKAALEADHADPVRDETMAELAWYMERVPGPGVDEKELEQQQAAAKGEGAPGAEEGDMPIPMPPGSEGGAAMGGKQPTAPPEGGETGLDRLMANAGGAPEDQSGGPAPTGDTEAGLPEPEPEGQPPAGAPNGLAKGVSARPGNGGGGGNADARLPKPPRE